MLDTTHTSAPVSAWMLGNKHEQGLPLVYHLAARGWVVVTPNDRLSPQARFPDHLVDSKRAMESVHAVTRSLEWARVQARAHARSQ